MAIRASRNAGRAVWCGCALALTVTCLAGCKPPVDPGPVDRASAKSLEGTRPNIVLITICTCRYAQLGVGGYPRKTSPFIDSLAAGGVLFENAVASSSWTKPTTASILTGLTPNVHRMTDYYEYGVIRGRGFKPKRTLADEIVTLAECLSEAGYATICRNNNIHASHFFNMTQGFADAPPIDGRWDTRRMLQEFSDWLGKLEKDRPFFFFMLTRDAHMPYVPHYSYYRKFSRSPNPVPSDQFGRYAIGLRQELAKIEKAKGPFTPAQKQQWIDLYDAELAQLDDALSRLPGILEQAGRRADTLIVLTADHGERLFDAHGALGHSRWFMGEPVLHIPLIFNGARMPQAVRIPAVVRNIDIYPTLAALAGAKVPDVVQGCNLMPLIAGDESFPELSAFASYREMTQVVRLARHKLRKDRDGALRLYDIEKDPDELMDLSETLPDVAKRMTAELDRWMAQEAALRELVAQGKTRALSPEVIERLRSLGYID